MSDDSVNFGTWRKYSQLRLQASCIAEIAMRISYHKTCLLLYYESILLSTPASPFDSALFKKHGPDR